MIKAGVRTTITNKVTVVIRSRPGEEEVGSKVYLKNANKYEDLYKINRVDDPAFDIKPK